MARYSAPRASKKIISGGTTNENYRKVSEEQNLKNVFTGNPTSFWSEVGDDE